MLGMLRIVRIAPRSAWSLAAAWSDPAHPRDPEHPHPSQQERGPARGPSAPHRAIRTCPIRSDFFPADAVRRSGPARPQRPARLPGTAAGRIVGGGDSLAPRPPSARPPMRRPTVRTLLALATPVTLASSAAAQAPAARETVRRTEWLYVWATATDTARTVRATRAARRDTTPPRRRGVVLLTVDLRPASPTRGQVTDAILADTGGRHAHHTEHALAGDGLLFANDFGTGRTHRFDLRTPGMPRLLGSFTTAGPLADPHSFVRLADDRVLATFQTRTAGGAPGGIAELRRNGTPLRWASAAAPGVDSTTLLPYSLEVVPALDRVVTTSTSMTSDVGVHVQVWRLSDLALLHTLAVPPAPAHAGHPSQGSGQARAEDEDAALAHDSVHHRYPGEPRLLDDGRTVMLGTFTCGMYRLTGLDARTPRLEFVHAFPGINCAVPARVGRWWVQTVPALHALVTLDVQDPAHPREVARLSFDGAASPHWLAADASGTRLVMDGGAAPTDARLHLATLDRGTGALAADASLPVIDLSRVSVPGLGVVRALPHGAVFGPGR